jgi:hypothetical protein
MRYGITQQVLTSPGLVEISEQEYNNISLARKGLFEALYLEEKFDLVTENYFEYEKEILSSSTRFMVFGNQDYEWIQNERNLISRRIINLLSASRLYLDQNEHHLNNIYGKDSAVIAEVHDDKATQYDTHIGYRTMEALRNYALHRGFPIHSVTFTANVVDAEAKARNRVLYTLTPFIRVSDLENDSTFKRSVLEELKLMGGEVDVKPLAREYVECLSNLHGKIRELLRKNVLSWESEIFGAIERFKSAFGKETSIIGLAIVVEVEDGVYSKSESIFSEFIERRRKLESKNRILGSLASRYVTNEVLKNHP